MPSPDELDAMQSQQQEFPGYERVTPSDSKDGVMTGDQQDKLNKLVYPYLRAQMERRMAQRDPARYEDKEEQGRKHEFDTDMGSLLGAVSEGGSMAGSLYGKKAESKIIPTMNANLDKSYQDRRKNENESDELEERQIGTDLNIAKMVEDGNEKEKARKDTVRDRQAQRDYLYNELREKRRHNVADEANDAIRAKRGAEKGAGGGYAMTPYENEQGPAVFNRQTGQYEIPQGLPPGLKRTDKGGKGSGFHPVPGRYGPNGEMVVSDGQTTKLVPMPEGTTPPPSKGGKVGPDGKNLSPNDILKHGEGRDAVAALQSLETDFDKRSSMMGPLEGRKHEWNPWDDDAHNFMADLKLRAQVIGKYLEGGVLRKEDEKKYEDMLPTLHDTPAQAKYKLNMVKNLLNNKQQADVNALKSQGYNTNGLGASSGTRRADGRVKMRNPKTNEPPLWVAPEDVDHAKRDGWEETQ